MSKTPCKKSDLTAFINAYAVALGTDNKILMGLSGDALNKLLDTLTFHEDLEAARASAAQAPTPKRQSAKVKQEDDGTF